MKSKIIALLICMMFMTAMVMAQDAAAPAAPAAAPAAAVDAKAPAAVPAGDQKTVELKAPAMMPLELRKTGVISVAKDASGKITSIKLIAVSYDVQLDEGSKPLEAMDGQKVKVTCTLSSEGGKRIIVVKNVEPVVEGGAAPAAPAVVPAAAPAVK